MKVVKAPQGFHWMKKGKNNFKLMKHTGKFVPHKGASLTAKFEVQKKHNAKYGISKISTKFKKLE